VTAVPNPITATAELAAACRRFAAAPRLAVDTEFLRERTYLAELALVQLGNEQAVALVDPLAGLELAPLAALLTDPALPKVLHAARQDIEVLLPLTGRPLAPLIDTQLAAALLGMPAQIGYADLVQRELGHALEKSQARTDWTRRPLSAAQLEYAADDVRWLLPLAARLETRLAALGRLDWLHEDCARLTDRALYDSSVADAWQRLKGTESLPPPEQLRLRTLAAWREARALRRNLPRGWVLADDGLRLIARSAPRDLGTLKALGAMAPGAADKLGAEILAELERASQLPLDGIVQRQDPRRDLEEQARTRRLGASVKSLAAELGLAPEVLATQRDLRRIARGEAVAAVLQGWRASVLGDRLAAAAAAAPD
jgi:ribonuclease D